MAYEGEGEGADVDAVAFIQLDPAGDAPTVDVSAVGAAQVPEQNAAGLHEELGVLARDVGVVEGEIDLSLGAADDAALTDRHGLRALTAAQQGEVLGPGLGGSA